MLASASRHLFTSWHVVLSYDLCYHSHMVALTTNQASGHAAVKKLRDTGIFAEIEVLQLDVTQDDHILAAMKFVGVKYGKLDDEWIQRLLASY